MQHIDSFIDYNGVIFAPLFTSDKKIDEVRMEVAEKREGEDEPVSEEEEMREGTRGEMRQGKNKG